MVVGQLEALGAPAGRALCGDFTDAVRAQEGPHAVVVTEWPVLVEDAMPFRLVDRRGRAVQEGSGAAVMLHEVGQAAAVGRQVPLPVVGLGDGEMEDVVGVLGQLAHVTRHQVDRDALDAGGLELGRGLPRRRTGPPR